MRFNRSQASEFPGISPLVNYSPEFGRRVFFSRVYEEAIEEVDEDGVLQHSSRAVRGGGGAAAERPMRAAVRWCGGGGAAMRRRCGVVYYRNKKLKYLLQQHTHTHTRART